MRMTRIPFIAAASLGLVMLLGACGGESSPTLEAVPGDPAPETHTARIADACALIDRITIEQMVGSSLLEGVAGPAIGTTSRCELDAVDVEGTDVAFQVNTAADGPFDERLATRLGFEEIFGPATEVDGLP